MKKIATLLFALSLFTGMIQAQPNTPDAYGYYWRDSNTPNGPLYNWIDIVPLSGAQNVRYLADDNTVGSFPIGFPFHFYWYDVTQFWVGSNGYIGFTNGQISSPFPVIPATSNPQNYIGALMSDLIFGNPGDSAECWRWTNPANDTLIVSYINVPFWQSTLPGFTGNNTFQIILSAVDSSVTFQYKDQQGMPIAPAIGFSTIGIENNSGNIGVQHSHDAMPPMNYAVKFYYPSNTTFSVTDVSTTYNNNPETGGLFLPKNGAPYVMETSVKNTGNQNVSPFNVNCKILNSVGTIQTQGTMMTTALTPGQSQNLTMTNSYTPSTAGTFTFVTTTQLAGDATPSNNQRIQELQIVDTTVTSIRLSFDSGVDAGLGGLNWTGGNGGSGIYFIPPFYPCNLTQLHAFIVNDLNLVGYTMKVFDDNGVGGAPGSLLDSEYVDPANVILASWNTSPLTSSVTINSGGVYVAWIMNGDGITLGQNQVPPFSNRTFEILGSTWAIYRARETEDVMINISIEKVPGAGVNDITMDNYFGQFYPNPSEDMATLLFDLPYGTKNLSYEIFDIQGKKIESKSLDKTITSGRMNINSSSLNPGIYFCKIQVDGTKLIRKLTVVK